MDESERDKLLIRMDTRQETMADDIASLKKALYGDDGQGGVCGRVSKLENFQSTILAFVAAVSMAITLAGNWLLGKLTGGN
jgi:hypothetical protein